MRATAREQLSQPSVEGVSIRERLDPQPRSKSIRRSGRRSRLIALIGDPHEDVSMTGFRQAPAPEHLAAQLPLRSGDELGLREQPCLVPRDGLLAALALEGGSGFREMGERVAPDARAADVHVERLALAMDDPRAGRDGRFKQLALLTHWLSAPRVNDSECQDIASRTGPLQCTRPSRAE